MWVSRVLCNRDHAIVSYIYRPTKLYQFISILAWQKIDRGVIYRIHFHLYNEPKIFPMRPIIVQASIFHSTLWSSPNDPRTSLYNVTISPKSVSSSRRLTQPVTCFCKHMRRKWTRAVEMPCSEYELHSRRYRILRYRTAAEWSLLANRDPIFMLLVVRCVLLHIGLPLWVPQRVNTPLHTFSDAPEMTILLSVLAIWKALVCRMRFDFVVKVRVGWHAVHVSLLVFVADVASSCCQHRILYTRLLAWCGAGTPHPSLSLNFIFCTSGIMTFDCSVWVACRSSTHYTGSPSWGCRVCELGTAFPFSPS